MKPRNVGERIVQLAKALDEQGKPYARIHVAAMRETLRQYFEPTKTGKFYIRKHQIVIVGRPARLEREQAAAATRRAAEDARRAELDGF